jgi:L-lactate permease
MNRVLNILHVVGLILVLSVVPAVLALVVVAILDEYLATWLLRLLDMLQINAHQFFTEASSRWPELIGMLVGMVLILGFLWMARWRLRTETSDNR